MGIAPDAQLRQMRNNHVAAMPFDNDNPLLRHFKGGAGIEARDASTEKKALRDGPAHGISLFHGRTLPDGPRLVHALAANNAAFR